MHCTRRPPGTPINCFCANFTLSRPRAPHICFMSYEIVIRLYFWSDVCQERICPDNWFNNCRILLLVVLCVEIIGARHTQYIHIFKCFKIFMCRICHRLKEKIWGYSRKKETPIAYTTPSCTNQLNWSHMYSLKVSYVKQCLSSWTFWLFKSKNQTFARTHTYTLKS